MQAMPVRGLLNSCMSRGASRGGLSTVLGALKLSRSDRSFSSRPPQAVSKLSPIKPRDPLKPFFGKNAFKIESEGDVEKLFRAMKKIDDKPDLLYRLDQSPEQGRKLLQQAFSISLGTKEPTKRLLNRYAIPFLETLGSPELARGTMHNAVQKIRVAIFSTPGLLEEILVALRSGVVEDFMPVAWSLVKVAKERPEIRSNTVVHEIAEFLEEAAIGRKDCAGVEHLSCLLSPNREEKGLDVQDISTVDSARSIERLFDHHDNDYKDYRCIQIAPTAQELMSENEPYLPGTSQDLNDHAKLLERQFRLLRQDMVGPFRDDLQRELKAKGSKQRRLFPNAQALGVAYNSEAESAQGKGPNVPCLLIQVSMPTNLAKQFTKSKNTTKFLDKEARRVLSKDSMVALVDLDGKVHAVGTIVWREAQDTSSKGLPPSAVINVGVSFSSSYVQTVMEMRSKGTFISGGFSLYQSPVSMFAVEPVLKNLKSMSQVPFGQEFLTGHPVDLEDVPHAGLTVEDLPDSIRKVAQNDPSQAAALNMALQQRVALIQGPPGTGKTVVGGLVVQACLWAAQQKQQPARLLILTLTNHALDNILALFQFCDSFCKFVTSTLTETRMQIALLDAGIPKESFVRMGNSPTIHDRLKERRLTGRQGLTFGSEFSRQQRTQYYNKKNTLQAVPDEINELENRIKLLKNKQLSKFKLKDIFPLQADDEDLEQLACSPDLLHEILSCASLNIKGPDSALISYINQMQKDKWPLHEETLLEVWREGREASSVGKQLGRLFRQIVSGLLKDPTPLAKKKGKPKGKKRGAVLAERPWVKVIIAEIEGAFAKEQFTQGLWKLNKDERLDWIQERKSQQIGVAIEEIVELMAKSAEADQGIQDLRNEQSSSVMESANIIGCTTAGAAKNLQLLQDSNVTVCLVEEAAEVLEAQVLTAVPSSVKHLIMIGDHLQLRPKVEHYPLRTDSGLGFNLDISLFERLADPRSKYPISVLEQQFRMRPEISSLIREPSYPGIIDHSTTLNREPLVLRGLQTNVCFIDHDHPEDGLSADPTLQSTRSHSNKHEALMSVMIARYMLQQGNDASEIVILTGYVGQLLEIQRQLAQQSITGVVDDRDAQEIRKTYSEDESEDGMLASVGSSKSMASVRVATIDNYQGEESKIVIISLVRSNDKGHIGFLSSHQRVNVLLSRARDGMFILGNSQTFRNAKSGRSMWVNILAKLEAMSTTGLARGLPVVCEMHGTRQELCTADDFFKLAPHGGCAKPCNTQIPSCPVGHVCTKYCHPGGATHEGMACQEKLRDMCSAGHEVMRVCSSDEAEKCQVSVKEDCGFGHVYLRKCFENAKECEHCRLRDERKMERMARVLGVELEGQVKRSEIQERLDLADDELSILSVQERSEAMNRRIEQEALLKEQEIQRKKASLDPTLLPPHRKASADVEDEPQASIGVHQNVCGCVDCAEGKAPKKSYFTKRSTEAVQDAMPSAQGMLSTEDAKSKLTAALPEDNDSFTSTPSESDSSSVTIPLVSSLSLSDFDKNASAFSVVSELSEADTDQGSPPATQVSGLSQPPPAPTPPDNDAVIRITNDSVVESGSVDVTKERHSQFLAMKPLFGMMNKGEWEKVYKTVIKSSKKLSTTGNPFAEAALILAALNLGDNVQELWNEVDHLTKKYESELRNDVDTELHAVVAYVSATVQQRSKDFPLIARSSAQTFLSSQNANRLPREWAEEMEKLIGLSNKIPSERLFSSPALRSAKEEWEVYKKTVVSSSGETSQPLPEKTQDDASSTGKDDSLAIILPTAVDSLMSMTGLEQVKLAFVKQVQQIHLAQEREKEGQFVSNSNLNVVYAGGPGTGKTTVARFYSKLLVEMKIIPEDAVVEETSGSKLCTGGTPFLEDILNRCKAEGGGVIFVDEAYTLNPKEDRSGRQILEYLLPIMENIQTEYGKLVFIFAGYKKPMDQLFEHNPGLPSRFPSHITFEDYTKEELLKIFMDMLAGVQPPAIVKGTKSKGSKNQKTALAFDVEWTYNAQLNQWFDGFGNTCGFSPDGQSNDFDRSYRGSLYHDNPAGLCFPSNPLVTPPSTPGGSQEWLYDQEKKLFYVSGNPSRTSDTYPGQPAERKNGGGPQFTLSDEKWARIAIQRIARMRGKYGFGNARAVRNMYEASIGRQTVRIMREKAQGGRPNFRVLTRDDVLGRRVTRTALEESPALLELRSLEGLQTIKENLVKLMHVVLTNADREEREEPLLEVILNRLFLGNPGTGKTSVAKLYAQILCDFGLLSKGEIVLKTASDFIGNVLGSSEQNTKDILRASEGCVLCIDEAYSLDPMLGGATGMGSVDPFRSAVLDTIVEIVQAVPGEDRAVVMLGYEKPMQDMLRNANPGLSRRFQVEHPFRFDDFDDPALIRILRSKAQKSGLEIDLDTAAYAIEQLGLAKVQAHFGNAGAVDVLLSSAREKLATANPSRNKLCREDFAPADGELIGCEEKIFDELIGCTEVLKRMNMMRNSIRLCQEQGRDPRSTVPYTFCFTGSPGTGKTTIARRFGQLFFSLGLLPTKDVIECSASSFSTGFVGQSGPTTVKWFEKAKGKTLFIDEAYALNPNRGGEFMREAVDEIVKCLTSEEYMGKMVVIFAGYTSDIDELLSVNQGLSSRVSERLHFPDFSANDVSEMLERNLEKEQRLSLSPECKQMLPLLAQRLVDVPNFANGRDVVTWAKRVYNNVADRLASSPASSQSQDGLIVETDDLQGALEKLISSKTAATNTISTAERSRDLASQTLSATRPSRATMTSTHSTSPLPVSVDTVAEAVDTVTEVQVQNEEGRQGAVDERPLTDRMHVALQSIMDSMGLNNEAGATELARLSLGSLHMYEVANRLADALDVPMSEALNMLGEWQKDCEKVLDELAKQREEEEKARQTGKKIMRPIWRCAASGRADLPHIVCWVRPYILRWDEMTM